jgi:hypothetical protein
MSTTEGHSSDADKSANCSPVPQSIAADARQCVTRHSPDSARAFHINRPIMLSDRPSYQGRTASIRRLPRPRLVWTTGRE